MSALYEHVLYPINGMESWPKTSEVGFEMDPPTTKRQRGRPRKIRREQSNQVRLHENGVEELLRATVITCGRCGQTGHNRRTCQNDPRVPTTQRTEASSSQPQCVADDVPPASTEPQAAASTVGRAPPASMEPHAAAPPTSQAPLTRAQTNGPSSTIVRKAQRCGRRKTAD